MISKNQSGTGEKMTLNQDQYSDNSGKNYSGPESVNLNTLNSVEPWKQPSHHVLSGVLKCICQNNNMANLTQIPDNFDEPHSESHEISARQDKTKSPLLQCIKGLRMLSSICLFFDDFARDDQFLNFRGSFANCTQLGIAVVFLSRKIFGVSVAPEDLNAFR
jgi:hypothetical protein